MENRIKLYWPEELDVSPGRRFVVERDSHFYRLKDRAGRRLYKVPFRTFAAAARAAEDQINAEADMLPRLH